MKSVSQAYEYQQSASSIQTLEPSSTQQWDLEQIDIWANDVGGPFPASDLTTLFNAALEDKDISFETNFSGFNASDPYAPIRFEISDYLDDTIDFQSGTASFDLDLNGPIQTDVLNKPHTRNYYGNLNYQAYFSDANVNIPISALVSPSMNKLMDSLVNMYILMLTN